MFKKNRLHEAVMCALSKDLAGAACAVDFEREPPIPFLTADIKKVKVRFIEGRNSLEVLDFNLFLSPQDVWAHGVTNG